MLIISEDRLNKLKNTAFRVYSKKPLSDGCECYSSRDQLNSSDKFYITAVKASNIKIKNNKFYYTNEEFDDVADFWPKHVMNIGTKFVKIKDKPAIKSNKLIVDVSGLPSFNGLSSIANEDSAINEYRFYLTLFNEYTLKQCQYERHNLYDAQFKSSKFDLVSKIQNSDFLKPKDFTIINARRADIESVPVGWIIKESKNPKEINFEYGMVYINMNNQITILWH